MKKLILCVLWAWLLNIPVLISAQTVNWEEACKKFGLGEYISHEQKNEKSGFKWVKVKAKCTDPENNNKGIGETHAFTPDGKLIIPKSTIGGVQWVNFVDNKYNGGYFVRKLNRPQNFKEVEKRNGTFDLAEAFTKEGNVIIPYTRYYSSIHSSGNNVESNKYIIFQNIGEFGLCELNGPEIAKGDYVSFTYDGYVFTGKKENGKTVTKTIHKRPTTTINQFINSYSGYYSNMPWLLMPGPNYTPAMNFNWNSPTKIDWNAVPVYGGLGDYVSNESNPYDSSSSTNNATPSSSSNRICQFCNGTGKKVVSQSVPTYGTTDSKLKCNECGQEYYRSIGHSHVFCGQCRGTGKAK